MASQRAVPRSRKEQQPKSERTKSAILRHAVHLASTEGLEGLTIGRLAELLKMSKSGLFAHFGSKLDLQLETIDAARSIFIDEVVRPALTKPEGMPRLWALCDGWLSLIERKVFEGGCFFTAASFEFDSRKGPVRDRIADIMRQWLVTLSTSVELAQIAGQLDKKIEAEKLAFEMHAIAMGAQWSFQLLDDKSAFRKARIVILQKLQSLATKKCPRLPTLK
jgi:AcrR family transcriptional regulator